MSDIQIINAQKAELETIRQEEVAQESVEDSLQATADRAMFNPMRIQRNFESLANRTPKKGEAKEAEKPEEEIVAKIESIEEIAEQFQERNPELQARTLLALRARISLQDSPEEIIKKLLETYPDHSLADEALDFLIKTSNPELAQKLTVVKEQFYALYQREILAGKNIALQSKEFASQGLGTPTGLRDLYRGLIQNPKDPATRFVELTESYSFDKLKTVIAFVLHSLGSDLKAKGPSIERGELSNLMTEAKVMQSILSVYRFFKSRMNLISSYFEKEGLSLPSRITFELLAKLFVRLLLERYPSADKLYQLGVQMGLQDEIMAEIIIFSQMRDAVRYVAPRLFKSEQHRQDILTLFLDILKELEEKEEEDEEEEEEDE